MTADEMFAEVAAFYRPACPSESQVWLMAELADPGFRDFILTAAYTGLREIVELARVRPEHYDPDAGLLFVPCGKGGRPRVVPVLAEGRAALSRAILASDGLVFSQPSGAAWTRQAVSKAYIPLRDAVKAPGTFHSLRHFYATLLLNRGASELDVAVALGHADKQGRPNSELVRTTYGHAGHAEAIDRLRALAA